MHLEPHDPTGAPVSAPQNGEFDGQMSAIAEAAGALETLGGLPVGEHACRVETLHEALAGALAEIESV
jgi:hypothetical protein